MSPALTLHFFKWVKKVGLKGNPYHRQLGHRVCKLGALGITSPHNSASESTTTLPTQDAPTYLSISKRDHIVSNAKST